MRIPLLLAGRPKSINKCASVYLPAGRWKVVSENLLDSAFHLSGCENINEQEGSFEGGKEFCVEIGQKGNETNLNIFAERIA